MINVKQFVGGVNANAVRVRQYKLGGDGTGGTCDCVGLVIGALRMLGIKYSGIHGSNYFARHYTRNLHRVKSAAQLALGQVVYKVHAPGDKGYDEAIINARYKNSGDLNDYYHIGVIISICPLTIAHCSSGGMHYDRTLGKWAYAGDCKEVAPSMDEAVVEVGKKAVVDVPNDGTLNVRADPRVNGRIITRIREGDEVEVTAIDGEWSQVKFVVGYVQTKFLRGEAG